MSARGAAASSGRAGRAAKGPGRFDLGAFLPYLINRAGARMAGAFAAAIAPHGVTLQEWRVIAALGAAGPQRLSGLAELTSIDISTLSRQAERMARRDLIARERAAADRRAVRLALSSKGRRVLRAVVPLARRYERAALSGFATREADALRAMLRRVYANLGGLPH